MTSLSASGFDESAESLPSSELASQLPGDFSAQSILSPIVQSAKAQLTDFASSDNSIEQMTSLFSRAKVADIKSLLSSWAVGDFSQLPEFAILDDVAMQGAQGAFAAENGKVYLNSRLAKQSSVQFLDPVTGAVGVAIEEIGHGVDELLTPGRDTAGDEGEAFKAAVLGIELSEEIREAIATEDDTATVYVNNRYLSVEQATRRGNSYNNTLKGTSASDNLYGYGGDDWLYGYDGNDKLYGGTGDDRLYGKSGDDYLSGWNGDDRLYGSYGDDRLYGGSGDDKLYGGSDDDKLYGSEGDDYLSGWHGDDYLSGSYGNDRLYGGTGNDRVYGGSGNDKLYGYKGDDYLSGWRGNDYLSGSSGNDTLRGYGFDENEQDTFLGGSGRDLFVLGDKAQAHYIKNGDNDYATVVDLEVGIDTVQLSQLSAVANSATHAYGYRLELENNSTWLLQDSDGEKIALFEDKTDLDLRSETFAYIAKPDLSLKHVSVQHEREDSSKSIHESGDSPTIGLGRDVTLNATIINNSKASSEEHNLRYWLSNDETLDVERDRSLGTVEIGAIASGQASQSEFTFEYNELWGSGTKYILFQADSDNTVTEANEENNISAVRVVVSEPKPDLFVTDATVPTTVITDSVVNISAYTKNNSGVTGAASSNLRYWLSDDTTLDPLSDRLLGDDFVGAIAPNSSEKDTLSFTYSAAWGTGKKYILFQADSNNQVSESDESNNITYEAITVKPPQPDLVAQNSVVPSEIRAGNSIRISTSIKNNGLAAAAGSKIRYWLSNNNSLDTRYDRLLGSDIVRSLAAGDVTSEVLNFVYDPSWGGGQKHILFEVDSGKDVSESNESNNITYNAIDVTIPKPDLTIEEASAPDTVDIGDIVKISARTRNLSDTTEAGSHRIRYWLSDDRTLNTSSDRLLGSDYVGSLDAGESEKDYFSFNYKSSWGSGTKYILFQADGENDVAESKGSNNVVAHEMFVYPPSQARPVTYQAFDEDSVFELNSNASAKHTIYLDFDGHTTSNTLWNRQFNGGRSFTTPSYSVDGSKLSFSTAERENIWKIWQRVAEDYSPFDVNVTTEAPSIDQLRKTSSSDTQWGIRVVIGGDDSDWYKRSAGGVGFLNSFTDSDDIPVYVFSKDFADQPGDVAEIATHEVGHALGLEHHGYDIKNDGRREEEYYDGHGFGETGWAPILGSSSKNLTQWSNGDYAGATNTSQDDLAIITADNGFGYRSDDHGNAKSSATNLSPFAGSQVRAYGIIEQNTDADWFEFRSSTGKIKLDINAFEPGPNLDILAELFDPSGVRRWSNDADKLSASFDVDLSAGKYYLKISGTGKDGVDGYSDYGSLGQYSITGTIA